MKLKAAFFDRDGVLNVDKSYLYKIEDLEWIDGAKEALAYLTKKGYTIFCCYKPERHSSWLLYHRRYAEAA